MGAASLPILILTLEGQQTRRAPLVEQLTSLGLDFELFMGVDGRSGLPAAFESRIDRNARHGLKGRHLTDPELAGALSHLEIHRRLVEEDVPRAIVLEDDAIVGTAFAAFARGELDAPGDLVLLDHWKGRVRRDPGVAMGDSVGRYRAHRVRIAPALATGYAITTAGARYLLANAFPLRGPADWPCDISRLHCVMVHPRIVDHPETTEAHSDLETGRGEMARQARRPAARIARLLRRDFWSHAWRKRHSERLADAVRLDLAAGGGGEGAATADGSRDGGTGS